MSVMILRWIDLILLIHWMIVSANSLTNTSSRHLVEILSIPPLKTTSSIKGKFKSAIQETILPRKTFCSTDYGLLFNFSCSSPQKILIVAQNIPMATQSGQDKRCFHILESLNAMGHQISLLGLSASPNASSDDILLLESLSIQYNDNPLFEHSSPLTTYREVLRSFRPQLVVLWIRLWTDNSASNIGAIIDVSRQVSPDIRIISFTDEVYSHRELIFAEHVSSSSSRQSRKQKHALKRAKKTQTLEKKGSDMVVAVTKADKIRILQQDSTGLLGRLGKVAVVRNVVADWELQDLSPVPAGYKDRSHLVFVGNGFNPVDYLAMVWWVEKIGPELDKGIRGVRLTVIGKGWETFNQSYPHSHFLMDFTGYLSWKDMLARIDIARVFVSPIATSTGLVTKNILALSRGIPLVTTPSGASGLCSSCDDISVTSPYNTFGALNISEEYKRPFKVGRDIYELIQHIKDFYYYKDTWSRYSDLSAPHIRSWFNKTEATLEMEAVLKHVHTLPPIHSDVIREAWKREEEENNRFRVSNHQQHLRKKKLLLSM